MPEEVHTRYLQLKEWQVPEDCYSYLFTHNYYPLISKIVNELSLSPKWVGVFFGQKLKYLHGQYKAINFDLQRIYDLFAFLLKEKIDFAIAPKMLNELFLHPNMDFESILTVLKFKRVSKEEILGRVNFLEDKFFPVRKNSIKPDKVNSIMGQLRNISEGNICLEELAKNITKE